MTSFERSFAAIDHFAYGVGEIHLFPFSQPAREVFVDDA